MPAQRPRPQGGTELQRALEGDKLHFQPLFGGQAFVCRDVQGDGVGGGEDAKLELGAAAAGSATAARTSRERRTSRRRIM